MAFGSFSSPANSPMIKGKFFSRLTSNTPPSPASSSSSAANSPTSLASPSCSLTALPAAAQGASKLKTPTVLKLAAASQKLTLAKPLSEQKESYSSNRHYQDSESSSQSGSTSSSRSSRSPTSRLPPSSAMDTIFEEDGSQGSKTSIGNDSDSSNMTQLSRTSTFAPRSGAQSGNGNNALSEEGDNGKRIVDNHTNFEKSMSSFNHSHSSDEEARSSVHPLQSPVRISQRSRRGATLSTEALEDLAGATNQFQSSQNLLRRQNSSSELPDSSLLLHSSSPLSYGRNKTLPVSRSIHCVRSRAAAEEMTKSDHSLLSRTASATGLDCISKGEANDHEIEWLEYSASVAKSRRRSNENMAEDKRNGLGKRPKVQSKFPAHIQRMLTEHLQKKMASPRPQSPLVMHQLISPHRSRSLRTSTNHSAHVEPPMATKDIIPRRKLAYSRSISEPTTKNKASSQLKDNFYSCSNSISMRKTATLPEKDSPPVSRLVMIAHFEKGGSYNRLFLRYCL